VVEMRTPFLTWSRGPLQTKPAVIIGQFCMKGVPLSDRHAFPNVVHDEAVVRCVYFPSRDPYNPCRVLHEHAKLSEAGQKKFGAVKVPPPPPPPPAPPR